MKNDIETFICRGFNRYFDVPSMTKGKKACARTAVVVKKKSFYDGWHDYSELFVEIAERVSLALGAQITVEVSDSSAGPFISFAQWREWCNQQQDLDPECIGLEPITRVLYSIDSDIACLMSLEDWSDVGGVEPYACSFTYSFYSCDPEIDDRIAQCLNELLGEFNGASSAAIVVEASSPRWYWRPLDFLRTIVHG